MTSRSRLVSSSPVRFRAGNVDAGRDANRLCGTGILLLFIIISFVFVEKLGRRPLLLAGGIVMAVCLFIVGGLGFKATLPGAALVALTCIWTAAYALSAGPLGKSSFELSIVVTLGLTL